MNVHSIMLSAKYGYRFLPVQRQVKKSDKERKAIKRMKKYVWNKGKFNISRMIYCHTSDVNKVQIVLKNLHNNIN